MNEIKEWDWTISWHTFKKYIISHITCSLTHLVLRGGYVRDYFFAGCSDLLITTRNLCFLYREKNKNNSLTHKNTCKTRTWLCVHQTKELTCSMLLAFMLPKCRTVPSPTHLSGPIGSISFFYFMAPNRSASCKEWVHGNYVKNIISLTVDFCQWGL